MNSDNKLEFVSDYIASMHVKNFFSLEKIELGKLGKAREIYFLGENGDGKSLILMSIVMTFNGDFIEIFSDYKETGVIMALTQSNYMHDFEGEDASKRKYNAFHGNPLVRYNIKNLLAYGVNRSRSDSEKASKYGFMTLFDPDQYLISPERWLMSLDYKELERQKNKIKGLPASISLDTAKLILADLLENSVEFEVSSSGVKFIERGTPLKFSQLSEGYKSVITWVCDMVARLSENQPEVEKIQDFEGVVLVDEINLHLHPRWEKQIVKKLRNWFPKVQFFFTTHSPVSILGASDDAVFYRVYKEEGVTKISEPYFKENMKDLMANSVLTSPLFGLDDARMESDAISKADLDTSDDYLYSRIHLKISERLQKQKAEGKKLFTKKEIDSMIEEALDEELA